MHLFAKGDDLFKMYETRCSAIAERLKMLQLFYFNAFKNLVFEDAGCVSFGQKWKTGTGRQYFTDIIGLSSTTTDRQTDGRTDDDI